MTIEKALFDEVSAVVTQPVENTVDDNDTSFILHAPLELCARYFLFPLVKDDYREDALNRMAAIKTRYEKFNTVKDERDRSTLTSETDFSLWSTAFAYAGHATVLAALSKRIGETNESIVDLLETMNATLSTSNADRFSWTKIQKQELLGIDVILPIDRSNIAKWFISNVANIQKSQGSSEMIAGIVCNTESAGLIEPLVVAWINSDIDPFDILHHVFPLLLRIAALSMIVETDTHSKYGWTHCLTIPHSHWVLADNPDTQKDLFCSALTYVASFRSVIGETEISNSQFEQYFDENEEAVFTSHYEIMSDIISRACVLEDAHLVKYVYSCFDIMKRDPHYTKLYISAALELLKLWEN